MKLTKLLTITLSAIIIGSLTVANTALATNDLTNEQEQMAPAFITSKGIIEDIQVQNNGVYYSVKEEDQSFSLIVTDETLIYDNTGEKVALQKGDKITAYTYAQKPHILIYPPHYNPEVVIVETNKLGTAQVETFDENLLNKKLSLQLHISPETNLASFTGTELTKEDLSNQHLLIFYTGMTKSIPAQATPHKIVILNQFEQKDSDSSSEQILAIDFRDVDGTKMVPLRLLAEKLGFQVEATNDGVILTKGTQSYTLTWGSKTYRYNDDVHNLETAPALLEPGKTYVPIQFINNLID